jgi:hypothetical protein
MKRHLICVLALVLAMVGVASAQQTTGTLAGIVNDSQGAAIPGATVSLTSEQGTKSFVTDAQGRFNAPFLTVGRYSVKVELTGFSPVEQKNVDVRLGATLDLAFTLKVGNLQEVVEVVGGAPVIDQSTTTTGGVLSADVLKRLPVGRNFTDTLYLVPGVSDSSGVGRSNPSIAGSSGLDNNYVVDGVNISNTGFGGVGTYSIVFGSLGTGVTTDFIKETQVKTGGFEAEYGQSTGGVVNVVTQSGTNNFHGSVFGYFRPSSLESSYKDLQTPNGTVNLTGQDNYDFGATVGGPLIKDKVFFFGAFNPQYQQASFIAPSDQEHFPLRSLGAVERKRRVYSYAGKLSVQATPNHRFDLSAFGDPSKGDPGPQRFTALLGATASRFSELESYGGHNQSLRYDGILSPNWLVEASFANATNKINEIPVQDEWQVLDTTVTPNVRRGGIGVYDKGGEGKNKQYSLKSTNIFNAGGNHQVRYGVNYEDISFARDLGRTGPTFTLSNGTVTRTGASITVLPDPVVGKIWRVTRANFGPTPLTTAHYLNFFLQDTWQIGSRLTVRPGVRWERQKLVGGGAKLCTEGESRPGANDGDGEPIFCTRAFDGTFSPRLGATYDLFGNGKSKIYASYGRFYSKIPNDLAARALSADASVVVADYFDKDLTRPVPEGVLAADTTVHLQLAGLGAAQFDPDANPTYKEEFIGGVEFEVGRSVNLGVRYVHNSLPVVLEDIGSLAMAGYFRPGGSPGSVEYAITNITPAVKAQSVPGFTAAFETPVHKYDAVEVTLNKNFSDNWALVTSYRWAKLSGNFEGFFRSDNGQSDPSITSLFDFPTNDPSYVGYGKPAFGFGGDIRYLGSTLGDGELPNDRRHQAKVYATYAWNALNLGVGVNAGSGRVLTGFSANPLYDSAGEIPNSVRGGGIETVDNVPGCNECGGFRARTPFEVLFDLHADYQLKVGGNQKVVLVADVFNLLNNQAATNFDTATEIGYRSRNPNYGYPGGGVASASSSYQTPRQVRLGARFEW